MDYPVSGTLTNRAIAVVPHAVDPSGNATPQGPTNPMTVALSAGDTMIGAVTETAPATDAASSGLNGRLQRIAQRLSSLIALIPTALGQGTMAQSLRVVVASDQSVISVSQTPGTPATTSKYTQAAISTASSGDNTLVAGAASQTIRVYRIMWTLASPGAVKLKDGAATDLTGAMSAVVGVLESNDGNPLFVTAAGNAFVANLSAAIQMSGAIWYTKS